MSTKYVYFFGGKSAEGSSKMRDLLGGKGANLAEMCLIGLPVPGADAYRIMVEEVSSDLTGGPGWVLPVEQSLQTAVVLDRIRAA